MSDYCGFADWPACTGPFNLANTGGGDALVLVITVVGILAVAIGLLVAGRRRK